MKLHPCHRMMAEIYSRFGEGSGGDRKWQAEIAGEIAKTFLNLEGSK